MKVEAVESELNIRIDYVLLATGEAAVAEFRRGTGP